MNSFDHMTQVRELRLALPVPLTLEELSDALAKRGTHVSAGHLSNIERGMKGAGPKLVAALADFFKVDRLAMRKAIAATQRAARRKH